LHAALKEVIAHFPVYRTYVDSAGASGEDRRDINWAVAQARKSPSAPDRSVFDYVEQLLTANLVREPKSGFSTEAVVRFAMKFQQYSGPVMAKGLEDTAFYRYNRLVSLNEVGGHPDHFGVSVASFHQANVARLQNWPNAMLSTSTHDTKRGEDTRCRLHALSEIPDEWDTHVSTWSRLVRARRGDIEGVAAPDRNDEYLLYQLLVGAWPAEMTGDRPLDRASVEAFGQRVEAAMIKSVREAKVHSTWAKPNEDYEQALKSFLWDCLDIERPNAFLESFRPFQTRLADMGFVNSLRQVVLKLTVPGVPDIYQGTELWDFALVDPDNRRAVDFAVRRDAQQRSDRVVSQPDWSDRTIKFQLISALLKLRKQEPALLSKGTYEPLRATGMHAELVCAFLRRHQKSSLMVVVSRLSSRWRDMDWGDTAIAVPRDAASVWREHFSGEEFSSSKDTPLVGDLLKSRPVAVLKA
jgi:(1->4)-alpha-D-glucan 1-alpha-D-glucosylmutase